MPLAYFFDAYGTLFDVHAAVRRHADAVGPRADAVSATWRAKQLEYSWLHALMEHYVDFRTLTARALDHALALHGCDIALHSCLMSAYDTLDAYPEVREVLARLKEEGAVTGILSNGSPDMLHAAVSSAGLHDVLDHVASVDAIATFKTRPETYRMMTDAAGCRPGDVSFQSSNRWDIAGAARFGCRTVWVNRTGQPDEYPDLAPDRTVTDLRGVLDEG